MSVEKTGPQILVVVLLLLSACTSFEYHETVVEPASKLDNQANQNLSEQELLDIGIIAFDSGENELKEGTSEFASVRQSEAIWFSMQLKNTLQNSNVWGAIRSMPIDNSVMDVVITGKIIESNGDSVKLKISVDDATGTHWFDQHYEQQVSSYAYNPEVSDKKDPFQSLFVNIANDLFDYRVALSKSQTINIRHVAKMRFAESFVPNAFKGFLAEDNGKYNLVRAPAANDPMMLRVARIRSRNDLFLDVIQDYYRAFNSNMAAPYQEWRKASYKEVIYARQLKKQARKEKIAGTAAILVGVLAQSSGNKYSRGAGHVGIFSGANMIYSGYSKQNDAELHSAAVRELSAALESELAPSVIDLEDRSVTLSGTVDEQFKEWRRLLGEMFNAENGVSNQKDLDSEMDQN